MGHTAESGVMAEIVRIAEERGLDVPPIDDPTWREAMDKIKQEEADLLVEAVQSRVGPGEKLPPLGNQIWHEEAGKMLKTKLPETTHPDADPVQCGRCGKCCNRLTLSLGFKGNPTSLWNIPHPNDAKDIELLRRILIPIEALEGYEERTWYRCSMLYKKDGVASCLIYDSRPRLCRTFEPGDSTCPDDALCKAGNLVEKETEREAEAIMGAEHKDQGEENIFADGPSGPMERCSYCGFLIDDCECCDADVCPDMGDKG